jgi:hypothetical protein
VRNVNDRDAVALQPPNEGEQAFDLAAAERAGWLVEYKHARTETDADGRFMLVTTTPPHYRVSYRVTYRARSTEGMASNPRLDADGTGRASIGVTLA